MIFNLLVFTCACALVVTESVPSYTWLFAEIKQAEQLINDKIISMDGNIPLLNDPRRHYAEILHVVNNVALGRTSCLIPPYFEQYRNDVNRFAPEALYFPQMVVNEFKQLIDDVYGNITEVLEVLTKLDSVSISERDAIADGVIKQNLQIHQARVYLAAGEAATILNKKDKTFSKVAEDLAGNQFVLTSASYVKSLVEAVARLHRTMSSLDDCE